jgi:DNA topoisomerase-2
MAGLSIVGRDNFGVFPLRGKLLNVRQAKTADMIKLSLIWCNEVWDV